MNIYIYIYIYICKIQTRSSSCENLVVTLQIERLSKKKKKDFQCTDLKVKTSWDVRSKNNQKITVAGS